MTRPTCPRCRQSISVNDTIAFDGNQIFHVNCRRPRDLSHEERAILFKYCSGHAVAECPPCTQTFRQQQLGSDLLGNRAHLCPRCRADLTENMREHLYACAMLPAAVRGRSGHRRAARDDADGLGSRRLLAHVERERVAELDTDLDPVLIGVEVLRRGETSNPLQQE